MTLTGQAAATCVLFAPESPTAEQNQLEDMFIDGRVVYRTIDGEARNVPWPNSDDIRFRRLLSAVHGDDPQMVSVIAVVLAEKFQGTVWEKRIMRGQLPTIGGETPSLIILLNCHGDEVDQPV